MIAATCRWDGSLAERRGSCPVLGFESKVKRRHFLIIFFKCFSTLAELPPKDMNDRYDLFRNYSSFITSFSLTILSSSRALRSCISLSLFDSETLLYDYCPPIPLTRELLARLKSSFLHSAYLKSSCTKFWIFEGARLSESSASFPDFDAGLEVLENLETAEGLNS